MTLKVISVEQSPETIRLVEYARRLPDTYDDFVLSMSCKRHNCCVFSLI